MMINIKTAEELERENRELKEIIDKLSYEIEDIKTLTNSKLRQENYVKGKLVRELDQEYRIGLNDLLLLDRPEGDTKHISFANLIKNIVNEDIDGNIISKDNYIFRNLILERIAKSREGYCTIFFTANKNSSQYKLYTTPDYDKRDNLALYRSLYCDGREIIDYMRIKYESIKKVLEGNKWRLPKFEITNDKKFNYSVGLGIYLASKDYYLPFMRELKKCIWSSYVLSYTNIGFAKLRFIKAIFRLHY